MHQSLSLGENCQEICDKLLGVGDETPRGNDRVTTDGPQTDLKEMNPMNMCFLQEACKFGARADQQGKLETKLSLDISGPFPTHFSASSLNKC